MSAKQSVNRARGAGPFQRFFKMEAAGGILLIIATVVAMIWANSSMADSYHRIVNWELTVQIGQVFKLSKPLILWVNDGLMALFFFVVGLEIKREILVGELSTFRQAALPIFAAIGGMLIPALLFVTLQGEGPGSEGWGIPMATDIAFSLGILSLLGKRVPLALKVFLAAFAIVDDLGAVLVIAAFYSESIGWNYILIALILFVGLAVAIRAGIRNRIIFMVVGGFVWYYVLKSGLHPTLAGVMLAFIVPVRRTIKLGVFNRVMRQNLVPFGDTESEGKLLLKKDQLHALDNIKTYVDMVNSPLQNMEHKMHGLTSFFVMPVFALANAGVLLSAAAGEPVIGAISINIALALIIGKVVGIIAFSWLGIKLKMTELPPGTKWVHLLGLGLLGGIGFTMSMFIASLAFQDASLLNHAKIGILIGSLLAGVSGYLVLKLTLKPSTEEE
ncbi:MAG TPA: Na+/H+ antiporter NhaA [Bacteroides sp.]|nr:Na+/H+ antiporter NhaA [Bacteroides sp.]